MNNTLDNSNNLDKKVNIESNFQINFNTAMKMSSEKYNYSELIGFLHSEKIVEKQIAVLELNEIKSKKDAQILVSNLVGQDGKIREAVAFKINELAQNSEYIGFFLDGKIFDLLLQGIMDINGNVCRQIVSGKWFTDKSFQEYLCNKLPESISGLLDEIEKIDIKSKQYVISKRNFQLYWCLEALHNIIDIIDCEKIRAILLKTYIFHDYTIREKTAKIVAKINNSELNELKEKLRNDENYYVRRYLMSEK